MIPIDHTQRERALSATESFIVQAPAGSGKTELLTQRFLRLLEHTEESPEEIVALTFTKKAAAEMRERILSSLQLAQQPEPSEPHKKTTWLLACNALRRDKKMQWNILENPNRLRIMTIDALGLYINQMAPLLGELGCQPAISDRSKDLYREAIEQLFTEKQSDRIAYAIESLLLHLDNRVEYVIDLILQLLQKREQWLPHTFHPNELEQSDGLKQQLEHALEQIAEETLDEFSTEFNPDYLHQLSIILSEAGTFLQKQDPSNHLTELSTLTDHTTISLENLHLWKLVAKTLLTESNEWRKTVTVRQGFPAKSDNKKRFLELFPLIQSVPHAKYHLTRIKQLPPLSYSEKEWEVLQSLLTILPSVVAYLRVSMQAKGTTDFTEVTLSALRALGNELNPTDLALYLDYQIKHLLIDEFQDTSIVQFQLFEKIINTWEQDDKHSVFLVGDPMQSIYRFRNAEVSLFLQAKLRGIGPVNLSFIELKTNFRSESNVVQWINDTFSQLMPDKENHHIGAVPYSSAFASRQAACGEIEFHTSTGNNQDYLINLILKTPKSESIAILVRSRSQLKHIIPALHQHRIKFNAIDIQPLNQTEEINDCLVLTKALLHREDSIAWLSLLRAPWCGLTLQDIQTIHHKKEGSYFTSLKNLALETNLTPLIQRVQFLIQAIEPFYTQDSSSTSAQLIESCWRRLRGANILQSPQAYVNCQQFFSLLHSIEEDEGTISLERLDDDVSKLYSSDSDTDAQVHIMTIHKSKGLEYDHVILPELQKKSANDSGQLLQWLERANSHGEIDLLLAPINASGTQSNGIYKYIAQTEKSKLAMESTRLLYVACTRAKKSLHLAFQFEDKMIQKDQSICVPPRSHLALLWLHYEDQWAQKLKLFTTKKEEESVKIFHKRLPLSELRQSKEITRNSGTDNHTELEYSLKLAPELPRIIGNIIHFELQKLNDVTYTHESMEQKQDQWNRQLKQNQITEKQTLEKSITKIQKALSQTQQCPQGQWILSNQHEFSASEFSVNHYANGKIHHYIIDRIIVNKNTVWIIDYKTAQPEGNEEQWIKDEIELYRSQLMNYKQAIKALYPKHDIKLSLYFPLCKQRWQEITNQAKNHSHQLIN
jgi:ATP-dependent helicase/nuclease subunit A